MYVCMYVCMYVKNLNNEETKVPIKVVTSRRCDRILVIHISGTYQR